MKSQKALGAIFTILFILATWGQALAGTGTLTLESAASASLASGPLPEDIVNTYFTPGERAIVTDLDPATFVGIEGIITDPPPDPVGLSSQTGWFKFDVSVFDTSLLESITFKVNAAVDCAIAPTSDDRYFIDVYRFASPPMYRTMDVAPINPGDFVEEQITFTQFGNDGGYEGGLNIGHIVSPDKKVYFRVRESNSSFWGPGLETWHIILNIAEVEVSYDYDEGALINDKILGLSGSESCPSCTPALDPGYPRFTVNPGADDDLYEDYLTIQSISTEDIQMPMRATLKTLTPEAIQGANTDGGGGRPPTGYWEYSQASNDGTTSTDDVLNLDERISRIWQIIAEAGSTFEFWVDVYDPGASKGDQWLGQLAFSPGSGTRGTGDQEPASDFVLDDGMAEIYAGSTSGAFIIANRFSASAPVSLRAVSFYTSGAAAGDEAEVIIYEDPSGEAGGPTPSMEIWRETVILAAGGFQEVPVEGCPVLNADAAPGAAFFVAVVNKEGRSCTLGIDMSGPCAKASYVSTDGGSTFAPLSSMPIINGSAMVRVHEKPAASCFMGVVMNPS